MNWLKSILLSFVLMLSLASAVLASNEWTTYSPSVFTQAQRENDYILVHVHADWCPTCKAQQPTLSSLLDDPLLQDVIFVKVDFDTDKDFLREHKVVRQSTLLVFHGGIEIARSVAETNPEKLRIFVHDGLAR